jgi:hypothetical protein
VRRQLQVEDAARLEPHDHVAWYGDGSTDLYALAGTALAAGARRNEKALFVAEDPDPTRLVDVGDLDGLVDAGRLELHAIEEVPITPPLPAPTRRAFAAGSRGSK